MVGQTGSNGANQVCWHYFRLARDRHNRRGNKADHISRCLVEERTQSDRGNLRLKQGEPHFSFA